MGVHWPALFLRGSMERKAAPIRQSMVGLVDQQISSAGLDSSFAEDDRAALSSLLASLLAADLIVMAPWILGPTKDVQRARTL